LSRGYAIVRTDSGIVRSASSLADGQHVDVELADGGFGARVEETRP
jgi:exonuclease VII large subunit